MEELRTSPNGLSQTEAVQSRAKYGTNVISIRGETTVLGLLLSQFRSPLVLILVFAAIVSAIAGEWPDA